jgi:cell division protein FtsZ
MNLYDFEPKGVDGFATIKVVGVGGAGGNAVNRMIQGELRGVEFIVVNTDAQDLLKSDAETRIRIGDRTTRGLGTGGNPAFGEKAAEESRDELAEVLRGADMVFITAGMGGGTGTGASPVIAEIAKETGALTVAVVTKPFAKEGPVRIANAEQGIAKLKEKVDAIIIVPNDRLLQIAKSDLSIREAFRMADEILRHGIEGISELITNTGYINLDFADVRSVMSGAGTAYMAIGIGSGEKRARDAIVAAIESPLLEVSIDGAKGILLNVSSGDDILVSETDEILRVTHEAAGGDANVIWGMAFDQKLGHELKVTLIATGFDDQKKQNKRLGMAERVGDLGVGRNSVLDPKLSSKDSEIPWFLENIRHRQSGG